MKRRVCVRGAFRDVTLEPHHYLDEYDGKLSLGEPPLLLEDDALWEQLKDATKRLREVESKILAAARPGVPLDEVELDAGRKLWRMLAPLDMGGAEHDHTKWAQIQAELLAHAQDTCICSPAWISTRRYASNGSWHALGCPKDSE